MPENQEVVIDLQKIVDVADGFVTGLVSEEELDEFGKMLTVRSYLPLTEKAALVMDIIIMDNYSNVEAPEIKIAELYRNLFFYVLLQGYAMVDCSDKELLTYENYDLIYPIFAQYILSFCQHDYDIFIQMLKDTINMYNINDLLDALENIDMDTLKEATKSNEAFLEGLAKNAKLVSDLKELAVMADPFTAKVADELQKIGIEKANQK